MGPPPAGPPMAMAGQFRPMMSMPLATPTHPVPQNACPVPPIGVYQAQSMQMHMMNQIQEMQRQLEEMRVNQSGDEARERTPRDEKGDWKGKSEKGEWKGGGEKGKTKGGEKGHWRARGKGRGHK